MKGKSLCWWVFRGVWPEGEGKVKGGAEGFGWGAGAGHGDEAGEGEEEEGQKGVKVGALGELVVVFGALKALGDGLGGVVGGGLEGLGDGGGQLGLGEVVGDEAAEGGLGAVDEVFEEVKDGHAGVGFGRHGVEGGLGVAGLVGVEGGEEEAFFVAEGGVEGGFGQACGGAEVGEGGGGIALLPELGEEGLNRFVGVKFAGAATGVHWFLLSS
jgi:hypothetical protein